MNYNRKETKQKDREANKQSRNERVCKRIREKEKKVTGRRRICRQKEIKKGKEKEKREN